MSLPLLLQTQERPTQDTRPPDLTAPPGYPNPPEHPSKDHPIIEPVAPNPTVAAGPGQYGRYLPNDPWYFYNVHSDAYDNELERGWNNTLDSVLVVAALFSAVLTAFAMETMKLLKKDPLDLNNELLRAIFEQRNNQTAVELPTDDFTPPSWVVHANALFFISLTCSLVAVFLAMLAKQWVREYTLGLNNIRNGEQKAQRRQFRYDGLNSWQMPWLIDVLPVIIHLSLLFFFVALTFLILDSNPMVGVIPAIGLAFAASSYILTISLAAFFPKCPYKTPLSRLTYTMILIIGSLVQDAFHQCREGALSIWQADHKTRVRNILTFTSIELVSAPYKILEKFLSLPLYVFKSAPPRFRSFIAKTRSKISTLKPLLAAPYQRELQVIQKEPGLKMRTIHWLLETSEFGRDAVKMWLAILPELLKVPNDVDPYRYFSSRNKNKLPFLDIGYVKSLMSIAILDTTFDERQFIAKSILLLSSPRNGEPPAIEMDANGRAFIDSFKTPTYPMSRFWWCALMLRFGRWDELAGVDVKLNQLLQDLGKMSNEMHLVQHSVLWEWGLVCLGDAQNDSYAIDRAWEKAHRRISPYHVDVRMGLIDRVTHRLDKSSPVLANEVIQLPPLQHTVHDGNLHLQHLAADIRFARLLVTTEAPKEVVSHSLEQEIYDNVEACITLLHSARDADFQYDLRYVIPRPAGIRLNLEPDLVNSLLNAITLSIIDYLVYHRSFKYDPIPLLDALSLLAARQRVNPWDPERDRIQDRVLAMVSFLWSHGHLNAERDDLALLSVLRLVTTALQDYSPEGSLLSRYPPNSTAQSSDIFVRLSTAVRSYQSRRRPADKSHFLSRLFIGSRSNPGFLRRRIFTHSDDLHDLEKAQILKAVEEQYSPIALALHVQWEMRWESRSGAFDPHVAFQDPTWQAALEWYGDEIGSLKPRSSPFAFMSSEEELVSAALDDAELATRTSTIRFLANIFSKHDFTGANYVPRIFSPLPSNPTIEDCNDHILAIFLFFKNIVFEGGPIVLQIFSPSILCWIDGDTDNPASGDHFVGRARLLYELTTYHRYSDDLVHAEKLKELQQLTHTTLRTSKAFQRILVSPELSYFWLTNESHLFHFCHYGKEPLQFVLREIQRVWADPDYSNPSTWEGESELAIFRRRIFKVPCPVPGWEVEEWPLEPEFWKRKYREVQETLAKETKQFPDLIPLPPSPQSLTVNDLPDAVPGTAPLTGDPIIDVVAQAS